MTSSTIDPSICELVLSLFDLSAIKVGGPFTLKSGLQSPLYIDLRLIVSEPKLLQSVVNHMAQLIVTSNIKYDLLCGVPYTALPIATLLSVQNNKPMLMKRKEVKKHGLGKQIEGIYNAHQICLVIEDLITSGLSINETVQPLRDEKLTVNDVIVLIDRQQGGVNNCLKLKLKLHSIVTLTQILDILLDKQRISQSIYDRVSTFVQQNQVQLTETDSAPVESVRSAVKSALPFADRAKLASNPITKQLFSIMADKKSNLCLSADVTTCAELLQLASVCGPFICCLKTHIDILTDFTIDLTDKLTKLSEQLNFLLFEDRKFADIGSTVCHQYSGGLFRTVEWSHITNAHLVPGDGVIDGLKKCAASYKQTRGLLLIAEMSSVGTLATGDYTQASVKTARQHSDFVIGFICQRQLISDDASFVHMTPGVQLAAGGDGLGQQYNTPDSVITQQGSDVIIVGRGILKELKNAQKLTEITQQYQEAGWSAYQKRIEQ